MDGNSRWAAQHGLPLCMGYERGVAALRTVVEAAVEFGVQALTVFAFSLENWQRSADEVGGLLELFSASLRAQLPELQAKGVRLQFMGALQLLPRALQAQLAACEAATAGNSRLLLTVAVSYSAQDDVAAAAQALARQVAAGSLQPCDITPSLVQAHLGSARVCGLVGPPDLLIRTGREQRLSNFMLLESSYAELHFPDLLWPAFGRCEFAAALVEFAARQRRFGRRPGASPQPR